MHRSLRALSLLPLLVACADVGARGSAAALGEDLGVLPGGSSSHATSVNPLGEIGGYGSTPHGQLGFRWSPGGGFTTLPASTAPSAVHGLNGDEAVGSVREAGFTRAARWHSDETLELLPTASGNPFDVARAVNAHGVVVGSARWLVSTGPSVYAIHATRWAGAGAERVVIPGAVSSEAFAINGAGEVVGTWRDALGGTRAFWWDAAGGAVEIAPPAGFTLAVATAINDGGEVVGYVRNASSTDTRAFSWTASGGVELLPLASTIPYAIAYGIDDAGRVAGVVRVASGAFHAAVFEEGAWRDLEPGSPHNSTARALNDDGVVVGWQSAPGAVARRWILETPNEPPHVTSVDLPVEPVRVGVPLSVSAGYTDPDAGDAHSATIDWGDGTVGPAAASDGSVTGTHVYESAGLYTVTVSVTDTEGETAARESALDEPSHVVVYDPAAGHVTGGGWVPAPDTGRAPARAIFNLVARYRAGDATPSGHARLRVPAGGVSFRATTFDWLVIDGPVARLAGSGEVDGMAGYDFVLTAAQEGASEPGFRLRITERATGAVLRDDRPDAPPTSPATAPLGGGSIRVHSR